MILNAYAVLDAFLSLGRLFCGLLLLWLGGRAWRGFAEDANHRGDLEDRYYLVFLLALLLLGLNVVSWPVFYLLLQSYVTEWPGVMCVYGVTQIGTGSVGLSRFLPGLLRLLQQTKPALVFVSGAWFVLYLANRHTRTAPLTGRVLALLLALGLLAVTDAAAEAAYLVLPKKEETPSTGCCMEVFDGAGRASRFLPQALFAPRYRPWVWGAYYAINGGMALALAVAWLAWRARPRRLWPALLLAPAAASLAVNAVFLTEVAAPALLHLPWHHCPYDLLPRAPEALAAIALFFLGCFSVGWAAVAGWLGDTPESRPYTQALVGKLFALALVGYLGSVTMTSLELALA
jgi:hypothetical protein